MFDFDMNIYMLVRIPVFSKDNLRIEYISYCNILVEKYNKALGGLKSKYK